MRGLHIFFCLVLLFDSACMESLQVSGLIEQAPNKTVAIRYYQELLDLNAELMLTDEPLTRPDYSRSDIAYPPPLNPPQQLQLRMFASLAAAAYCMSWNLWPQWKCGDARCSDSKVTLRALNETASEFGNDSVWFTRILNSTFTDVDLLKRTRIHRYVQSSRSAMVGYVAENDVLDSLSLDPATSLAGKKTIIISFRGSLHPKNFVYDLNISELDLNYPGSPDAARIHSGFWLVWKSLEEQVVEAVKEIVQKHMASDREMHHFDIWVTGHSLGGSVSLLCALELQRLILQNKFPGLENETESKSSSPFIKGRRWYLAGGKISIGFRVYSYGQPRTGNTEFANWVTNLPAISLFRTTFYNDLIVHLPPRAIKLPILERSSFFHHASEFHIKSDHEITIPCDSNDYEISIDRVKGQHLFRSVRVKNHLQSLESPMCSNGVMSWNLISHLTYWDIIFGPWC